MRIIKFKLALITQILILGSCSTEIKEDIEHIENKQSFELSEIETLERRRTAEDFLDYGLYWSNANNQFQKAFDEGENKVLNVSNTFYNPSKPTVIYYHGWQNGSSQKNYERKGFQFIEADSNTDVNILKGWKDKGWNVGVYYWNQFADELELKNAEAKIWKADNGFKDMRYRLSDGSYKTTQSPNKSLSELAFEQISTVLATNTSRNIRFVGHSLGSQLAVNVAHLFSNATNGGRLNKSLMPNRIELLDPFWSKGDKSYLRGANGNKQWTGERVRECVVNMVKKDDVAVTWYKSSLILNVGIGDQNNKLKDYVAFQSVRPWYLNSVDIVNKHVAAKYQYFWSMAFDAPKEVTLNFLKKRKETGNVAASASTSNRRIKELMNDEYLWDQVEGRNTPSPGDDQYELKKS